MVSAFKIIIDFAFVLFHVVALKDDAKNYKVKQITIKINQAKPSQINLYLFQFQNNYRFSFCFEQLFYLVVRKDEAKDFKYIQMANYVSSMCSKYILKIEKE